MEVKGYGSSLSVLLFLVVLIHIYSYVFYVYKHIWRDEISACILGSKIQKKMQFREVTYIFLIG